MSKSRKALLPLLISAVLLGAPEVYAKAKAPERPQTYEQVSMALDFVDKLLTTSSLAKHIKEENFPPAVAYLAEARRLHEMAKMSLDDNNLVSAIAKRDEAIRLAFEAGHLSEMSLKLNGKPKKDFDARLRSIQALMKAYENIAGKSGKPELIVKLKTEISADLDSADKLRASGDYIQGRAALDKAYVQVRSAIEAIRGGQTLGELSTSQVVVSPLQRDYESKLRSIHALLEAQQRIADEKVTPEKKASMKRTVTALLNSANDYASAADYEHAMETVNQVYKMITTSIEQLRGGETLVRALHFETPEEEYHYEMDRNDTYGMLIHMLVEDKKTMQVTPRIQQFLDQADALRKLAERQAQNGEFVEAIKSLEQSTRNLIFAMRNAGFFIPG